MFDYVANQLYDFAQKVTHMKVPNLFEIVFTRVTQRLLMWQTQCNFFHKYNTWLATNKHQHLSARSQQSLYTFLHPKPINNANKWMFHNNLINPTNNIPITWYIHQHEPHYNNQFKIKLGIPINPKHKQKKKIVPQQRWGKNEILPTISKLSTPKRTKSTQ